MLRRSLSAAWARQLAAQSPVAANSPLGVVDARCSEVKDTDRQAGASRRPVPPTPMQRGG